MTDKNDIAQARLAAQPVVAKDERVLFDPLSPDYIKPWQQRLFAPGNRNIQTAMEAEIAELRVNLQATQAHFLSQQDLAEHYRAKCAALAAPVAAQADTTEPSVQPLGICCYGGPPKPKSACASCAAWQPRTPATSAGEADTTASVIAAAQTVEACNLLNAEELAALRRFDECAQDGEGYDVPKEMMQRLAEIGVVQRRSGSYYQATEFGQRVLAAPQNPVLQAVEQPADDAEEAGHDDLQFLAWVKKHRKSWLQMWKRDIP